MQNEIIVSIDFEVKLVTQMKVSVCIFTHNHENYIAQAIDGALMQKTNFDFEIIIGEDCSTDHTRKIVIGYQKKYPNKIRVLLNDRNLGLMENLTSSLSQCTGEYIAVMDGDDFWLYDYKLQKQIDFLESNQDFSLCFHDSKVLSMNGKSNKRCCGNNQKKIVRFKDVIYNTHIPTSSLVFRKSMLNNFPPTWFCSLEAPDRPLFLLLLSSGMGYYFNHCWGIYRKHLGGHWTRQNYLSRWLVFLKIYKVMDKHFKYSYSKYFNKYKGNIYYILASKLAKNGKFLESKCCIQRYVNSMESRSSTRKNVFQFWLKLLVYKFIFLINRVKYRMKI